MKIIIIFLFFFSLLNISKASQIKSNEISEGCNYEITDQAFKKFEKSRIKKIEIDVNNYRNWTRNNINIITTNSRFISNNLKKNFKANLIVTFEDNSKCFFKARVRHSGDAKDHIAFKNNSIIQSIDVRLKNGNIKGITKFKLFKPDVRGNLEDVILQTQLLRNFGYLGPRSFKINARINQTESVMLFQEKAAKELLEFNNRREGPILEGDQKFFFKLVKDIPDNQLSNWDVGTPFLRNQSSKVMLSKLTNANLINRSLNHKEISLNAVNNLNLIYLYWSNRFNHEKNNYFFFDYDLDNSLLSFFNDKKTVELDMYNLLMQSTNSQHALSASNRKFYWNSIENYFEPINYDSNPNIDKEFSTTTTANIRFPISNYYHLAFEGLKNNLKKIDLDKLNNQITRSGLDLTKTELSKKIKKIENNLQIIEKNYKSNLNKDVISYNSFKPVENILNNFHKNLKEIDPNTQLIKFKKNKLFKCELYLENCEFFQILDNDFVDLLEGELTINNINYQYIGKELDFKNFTDEEYNILDFNNSKIFFQNGIELNKDIEKKSLIFTQTKIGARAFILGGNLNDINIIFKGKKIINFNENIPNFPIDRKGLTGCLSFVDVKVKNTKFFAENSSCEDTLNFINASGIIDKIEITNSLSDGLDVDFSNLKINQINITKSGNDCADFSAGNYTIDNLDLKNCGDKGVSIGEKSDVFINKINIKNSITGVATKDSSKLTLRDGQFDRLNTCVSAYKKKQEFDGGFINVDKLKCSNFSKKVEVDNFSSIIFLN